MSGYVLCIPRNETAQPHYFQNRIIMFCLPVSTSCMYIAIYIFIGSVCLFCCSQIGRPILGIYTRTSLTYMGHGGEQAQRQVDPGQQGLVWCGWMDTFWNWELDSEFHFWEYINRIFGTVWAVAHRKYIGRDQAKFFPSSNLLPPSLSYYCIFLSSFLAFLLSV